MTIVAGESMQGRRCATMVEFRTAYELGTYCKTRRLEHDGVVEVWHARGGCGHVAQLDDHDVTEHQDGTISVSPSVACPEPGCHWHAILEHGVWRLGGS